MNTKQPHEFKIGDRIETPSQGMLTVTGEPLVRHGHSHVIVPTDIYGDTAFDQNVNWTLAN